MSLTGHTTEIRERNPKNQQKDVESRCFLEEIPRQKECAIHKGLASTSQEEKLRSCCFKFQGFSAQAAIFSSRIHPCRNDFLRLSPSVSLSPLLSYPASCLLFLTDLLSSLSHFLPLHISCCLSNPCDELHLNNNLFPEVAIFKPPNQLSILWRRQ